MRLSQLTMLQWRVLSFVHLNPSCYAKDIASGLDLPDSEVSRITTALRKKHLLSVSEAEGDRRFKVHKATYQGRLLAMEGLKDSLTISP